MKYLFYFCCLLYCITTVADPFDSRVNGPVYSKWKLRKMNKLKEKPVRTRDQIEHEIKRLKLDYEKNECHYTCYKKYYTSIRNNEIKKVNKLKRNESEYFANSYQYNEYYKNIKRNKRNRLSVSNKFIPWTCPKHEYHWTNELNMFTYSKERQRIMERLNELSEELKQCQ